MCGRGILITFFSISADLSLSTVNVLSYICGRTLLYKELGHLLMHTAMQRRSGVGAPTEGGSVQSVTVTQKSVEHHPPTNCSVVKWFFFFLLPLSFFFFFFFMGCSFNVGNVLLAVLLVVCPPNWLCPSQVFVGE